MTSSANMEKEGLIRTMQYFKDNGLNVSVLITDQHKSIAKWIRETHPNITHYYDVWHVAKCKLCDNITMYYTCTSNSNEKEDRSISKRERM